MTPFAVIIPAAGRSVRFGRNRNKLLERLHGLPVIAHTVRAFLQRPDVARIVIATTDRSVIANAVETDDARIRYCPGGASRAESVEYALRELDSSLEWVGVHDGARPLVSQALIDRALIAARDHGAAAPAIPVALTIKQAAGPLPAKVQRTVPRQSLFAMQTPQIMRCASLRRAFERCPMPLDAITDDAQLLELAGEEVWLVEGEETNVKITTDTDLLLAAALLQRGEP